MKMSLTKPCGNCPFRTDVTPYLRADRVTELERELIREQRSFTCHKTTVTNEDGESIDGPNAQHCAGAMILLERLERPNQWMRWMERQGVYDPSKLDMEAPVFATFATMREAQGDYEESTGTGEPCSIVGPECDHPAGWGGTFGIQSNDTADAEHWCSGCGQAVCSSCSVPDGESEERLCTDCAEEMT